MELGSSDWTRAKKLFQSLLDLDPAERQAFLDGEALSPELSAALEELLKAHRDAGSFLDPVALHASNLLQVSIPAGIHSGNVLCERFKIMQFRARGGMGEVYEAEDLELQMPVAVKVIRPEIVDLPGVLTRFKREVHLAKQVTHPNVCRIFDIF